MKINNIISFKKQKKSSLKIDGNHIVNVDRYLLKIKNKIEIIKPAVDVIKCPYCLANVYIIHDLKDRTPISINLYCPKCNTKIFSKIIINESIVDFKLRRNI